MRWLLFLVIALAAIPAHAQQRDRSQEALLIGYEADELFLRGRWDQAYRRFEAADRLAHSPVFVLYMARCRKNAGKLLAARAIYQRVAREPLETGAPEPFRRAVEDGKSELAEVETRVASLTLTFKGARDASVTIDGKPVAASGAHELDPGSHAVVASASGKTVKRTVELDDGEKARVELSFLEPQAPEEESQGSLTPAIVAFSLGGVGLALGAITGAIAAVQADKIKDNCIDGHCLAEDADALATAKALATTATVGFVVGGVGVGTGIVLVIVRPGGGPADSAWIGVGGSF